MISVISQAFLDKLVGLEMEIISSLASSKFYLKCLTIMFNMIGLCLVL